MPNYEDIRDYFDRSDLLQSAVRGVASVSIVTGFTLDVDPLWSHYYDVENSLVDFDQAPLWTSDPRFYLYDRLASPSGALPLQPPDLGYRRRDLNKTPHAWKLEAGLFRDATNRERLPVVLTVVHRPLRARGAGDSGEEDVRLLQQLIQTARNQPVLLRVEERPRARFAFTCGDEISIPPSKSGTLGGVLSDARGVCYGVTCAHVAETNDSVYDTRGNQIGLCVAHTSHVSLAGAKVCDPVNLLAPSQIPGNGPEVNMLDCALIKLAAQVMRAPISGVAQALSPGQSVVLTGAATQTTRHWLGSLCLSYAFSDGGQSYCFRDAIEVLPQPRGLLGCTTVPVQGDSGGWILTDDRPPEWAGLFFGEDGKRGFAVRAKWALEWAQKSTGLVLTP